MIFTYAKKQVALFVFIFLLFTSCQKEVSKFESTPLLPTHLMQAHQFLNQLDSIYQKNAFNPFSEENTLRLAATLRSLDSLNIENFEFLKVKALRLQGANWSNQGDFKRELEKYQAAEKIVTTLPNFWEVKKEEAEVYNLLGVYFENIARDFGLAESYHLKNLEISEKMNDTKGIATSLGNLGAIYSKTLELDKAEKFLLDSKQFWEKDSLSNQYKLDHLGLKFNLANTYRQRGLVEVELVNIPNSEKYFSKSKKLFHSILKDLDAFPPNEVASYYPMTHDAIANVFLAQDFLKANYSSFPDSIFIHANQAVEKMKSLNPNHPFIGFFVGKRAIANAIKGDSKNALKDIDDAIQQLVGSSVNMVKRDLEIPVQLNSHFITLCFSKAKVLEIIGKKNNDKSYLKKSLEQYDFTLSYIEKIRTDFISQDAKESISNLFSRYVGEGIQVALHLNKISKDAFYLEKAFELSERNKSYSLRNNTFFHIIKPTENKEEIALWEREQNLKFNIQKFQILKTQNPIYYDSLLASQNDYRAFIQDLKTAPKNSIKQSYYWGRLEDKIPSLSYLQNQIIDNSSAILEYHLQGNESVVFVITKNNLKVIPLELDADFFKVLPEFTESLKERYGDFSQHAFDCYRYLFQPIEAHLGGISNVTIVPDRQLSYLAFENLLTLRPKENNTTYATYDYLFKKYTINYIYSFASQENLKKLYNNRPEATNKISAFIAYPEKNQGSVDWGCAGNIPLEAMAKNILDITNDLSLEEKSISKKATIESFLISGIDAKILHFTLHGCFLAENNPLANYLQFYPTKNSNGQLKVVDIYQLQLNNRLVVLGNCNTGSGKLSKPNGLQSISYAFLNSGCQAVITALDKVEDQPTAVLLEYFYKNIFEGQAIHVALKNAKVAFLNDEKMSAFHHPRFWSNFICIGDTDAI